MAPLREMLFDIPLIKDLVTKHLSRNELAKCVLVSKAWHEWFTPTLWRTIICRTAPPPAISDLRRYQHLVRSLSILNTTKILPTLDRDGWTFPRLLSLEIQVDNSAHRHYSSSSHFKEEEEHMLNFIESTPSLTHLQLNFKRPTVRFWDRLIQLVLLPHPGLQHLTVAWIYPIEMEYLWTLVQSCKRLTTLKLWPIPPSYNVCKRSFKTSSSLKGPSFEESISAALLCKSFSSDEEFRSMRVLDFGTLKHGGDPRILIWLLQRCPHLEKLILRYSFAKDALKQIISTLEGQICLHLKCLILRSICEDESMVGELLEAIGSNNSGNNGNNDNACGNDSDGLNVINDKHKRISGCGILRTNGSQRGNLGYEQYINAERGLVSYEANFAPGSGRHLLALTRFHAQTLTCLELPSRENPIDLRLLMKLLSKLPKLQVVNVSTWLNVEATVDPGKYQKYNEDFIFDNGPPTWTCLGLQQLDLRLQIQLVAFAASPPQRLSNSGDDPSHQCDRRLQLQKLFGQVGEMQQLRSFKLTCNESLLHLSEDGYLGQLAGLKRLRRLGIWGCYDLKMGLSEAQWILGHWKELVCLETETFKRGFVVDTFRNHIRAKKPWMKF
ncbi:hypothetical protein BX616_010370 [Lobosporangium transversale]|uniref:F-box domain-containing protein n=1 Tax=Lobosporangium transversale TaxID=64571 RepID=A0A1Y2GY51_9FUNG|nr:hypothetical protein BCR41DRAFT_392540 [Lobosporangium transversale]KAF9912234.1 hypothetical protein BX616_010370 [Lobosporangium transversale]ORZ27207.1 hypothetical protein BCR41DRAFT_392540 [Lobosporangium transversale]|eukprot:XP_021884934.1 hypothetical protein BCR41DRAFT_392540 [Lobosporangium transversale]